MSTLAPVFAELSALLRRHIAGLSIKTDAPGNLYVELPAAGPKGKPRFFGAVQLKKAYVSVHLMPVYEDAALLHGTSEALRAKMHGKSCFNFTTIDAVLFAQLDTLTAACARAVR